jgi:hypothetical protein
MWRVCVFVLVTCAFVPVLLRSASAAEPINPVPRPVLETQLHRWDFEHGTDGWIAEHDCVVAAKSGWMTIESQSEDPYLHCLLDLPGGPIAVHIRMRTTSGPVAGFFWTTDQTPNRGQDKQVHFQTTSDGQWHEYVARFEALGRLTDLRLDPSASPGLIEVDWIEIVREEPHPLTLARAWPENGQVHFELRNHRNAPLRCTDGMASCLLPPQGNRELTRPMDKTKAFEAVGIEVTSQGLPPVHRSVFLHHPEVSFQGHQLKSAHVTVQVVDDGSGATIVRDGEVIGLLAPILHQNGRVPQLKVDPSRSLAGRKLRLHGDGVAVSLELIEDEIRVYIESQKTCEGPVIRCLGDLQQGLLAGLEYLGQGESSSSTLDIETPEHLRFLPDRMQVTMPLMAFVTSKASMALSWNDMQLQPVFSTPNFFDGSQDHRCALRGDKIEATLRVGGGSLEDLIVWAVQRHGLPPLPTAPRSDAEQREICLRALNGPLKTKDGWGHCVQSNWQRRPFADVASAYYRLNGEVLALPKLVPGGAHVPNATIYFLTGRADEWLNWQKRQVASLIQQQKPDGSYRYDGEYRRGHFEDTASGVCARPAAVLLEYAYTTGDRQALQAGLRTLEYMKRFRTPRGAQVWEVPLHTPDQLASAYLVWAYVRGYELTGEAEYLDLARKWAISGIPFTYLWDCYPIMRYSTPPVFGATFWRHSWFGLPVQWVGGVYAYALTMLSPHDQTLDWNHLAKGILLSGEQQQYPDGDYVGLLPDSFHLRAQRRQPADINPCALFSLRMRLSDQVDSLDVAAIDGHRVAAPFRVVADEQRAVIAAPEGTRYQVLVDGQRIIDIVSEGNDVIDLRESDD